MFHKHLYMGGGIGLTEFENEKINLDKVVLGYILHKKISRGHSLYQRVIFEESNRSFRIMLFVFRNFDST